MDAKELDGESSQADKRDKDRREVSWMSSGIKSKILKPMICCF